MLDDCGVGGQVGGSRVGEFGSQPDGALRIFGIIFSN
jgi:hypothetical protein